MNSRAEFSRHHFCLVACAAIAVILGACQQPGLASAQETMGSDAVSAAGGATAGGGVILSFTLGEVAIGPASSLTASESAGFLRPSLPQASAVSDEPLTPAPDVTRPITVDPNPFRSTCTIRLSPATHGLSRAVVFDVLGRPVRLLADGVQASTSHELVWDGRDNAGRLLPAGLYFLTLTIDAKPRTVRLMRTK